MTEEELEKEATEYAQKLGAKDFIAKPKEIVAYFGYLAGAEPREKRIAELKAQIEKMKDCINDLVHLGEFNENTDEEYTNYLVHEALKNAEQFLNSEVKK